MVGADALVAAKGELQHKEVYKLDSFTYKFVYFTTSLYAIVFFQYLPNESISNLQTNSSSNQS